MTEVLAVAVITVLAVIAPGADFAMVVRNSYLYGRRTGLLGAAGVAAGVLVHVTYTMLGVGLLIASSAFLFTVVKLTGAAYLVYIGVRTFRTRAEVTVDLEHRTGLTPLAALRTGFLTNVLNPKTTLFVVSTFAQVVDPGTPLLQQAGYGLFMSLAHLLWFGVVVALFFSHDRMRGLMLRGQRVLNKVIGTALAGLGVSLALAPTH
ncbi:LysE family transporter [Streptomyces althioticus]